MAIKISKPQLKHQHKNYQRNYKLWRMYMAAYKGTDAIIQGNYIKQHEREDDSTYQRRMQHLYGFGYSKSVCSIFTYHLLNKPPTGRTLKALEDNALWEMFWEDADLYGNDYDSVMGKLALNASIQGHMGILVDKPNIKVKTVKDQKDKGIYPYMAIYHPPAIIDWLFEKNKETHRPELVFLKLREDDGHVRIIWKDYWAVFPDKDEHQEGKKSPGMNPGSLQNPYPMVVTRQGQDGSRNVGGIAAPGAVPVDVRSLATTADMKSGSEMVEATDEGSNLLGEVPFVWLYNEHTDEHAIGESDLSEIARMDISIIMNASQIEEVVNYAAFPMMLKPKRDASPTVSGSQQEDEVGVTAIIEFDPEYPDALPRWLTPEVRDAIQSILNNMSHKVSEIYRAANIGGLASTEVSTQAKSGVALKTEFQMLNSKLVKKSINLEKAENNILGFWLKWEALWEKLNKEVRMGRAKSFSVEDIAADLANALTAQTVIVSDTFNTLMQQQLSRQILPSVTEDEQAVIDQEIEDGVQAEAEAKEKQDKIDSEDDTETQNIINEGTKTIGQEEDEI